jgi:UPF0755 protein
MKTLSKYYYLHVFVIVFVFILFYFFFLSAPNDFKAKILINVEQGKSLRNLSATLQKEHLIKSRVAFEIFVIIYGGEKHLVPGDYLFKNKTLVFEVARRISMGEYGLPPIKVTIPEGFNNTQISIAFGSKLPSFNKDNFLTLARNKQGYLFPDTYFFLTTNNEENVIKLMSENYEKKITPLLPTIKQLGKSEKEIITMASIIEGEAKGNTDRGVISGILWKRIGLGMLLQVDTASSTYKIKGLPDAPISNPGIAAIKAAMYPSVSPYIYYLHDASGNIHYAKTFEEHKANKLKYLK